MRIVLENGSPHLRNMGDVVLIQTAIRRLRELWPEAEVKVVTDTPHLLKQFCPDVLSIPSQGRFRWSQPGNILPGVYRFERWQLGRAIARLEEVIRLLWPRFAYSRICARLRKAGVEPIEVSQYFESIMNADLVVASGGGYLTDVFPRTWKPILETLLIAIRLRKPTAIFGVGIGPARDSQLLRMMKMVLPRLDVLSVRCDIGWRTVLEPLGIPRERAIFSGDDGVEMAYEQKPAHLGNGLGLNMRVCSFSPVPKERLRAVREAVQQAAKTLGGNLLPIPIFQKFPDSDSAALRELLAGWPYDPQFEEKLDTPLKLIRQVGQCRAVVTGSYHGAVFAISQGIPAICLVGVEYYRQKFEGLKELFPSGITMLFLDDSGLHDKLLNSIRIAWASAENVRPQLLQAAREQIARSRMAYRLCYEAVLKRGKQFAKGALSQSERYSNGESRR